jgi:hypothetical protein
MMFPGTSVPVMLVVLALSVMGGGGRAAETTEKATEAPANAGVAVSLPFPQPPHLVVPCAAAAPTMDGYVNDEEWADAVSFSGLVDVSTGCLSDRKFTGFLKADGQKLYLAFRMKVPNSEGLLRTQTARDSDVYFDDSWEMYLYPEGSAGKFYQLVVNARGAIWDAALGLATWNGNWEIKQHFEVPELKLPDLWEAEVAIPWADLGLQGDSEGKKWGFGFFVNQKTPGVNAFGWTPQVGSFAQPAHAAVLSFQKEGSVIRLVSFGKPRQGVVAPVLRASGPPRKASFTLTLPTGESIKKTASTPDEPIRFPPLLGKGKALLTLVSPDDATADQADFYYSTLLEYDSVPFTVKPVNYPSRKELCLEIDFETLEKQEQVKQYVVSFGAWSKVCERSADVPWEKVFISTESLNAGELYSATVTLLDANRKELGTQSFSYTKEGKEPWLNNQIGIEPGRVPSPYTPMQVQGTVVDVIGRRIELAATGLPKRIQANGVELLTEPIRLLGNLKGGPVSLEATTPFQFTSVQADDSSGSAEVTLGPLAGTLKQTISFDGLCWYELELSARAAVLSKEVVLEIRLPRSVGTDYQFVCSDLKLAGLTDWDFAGLLKRDLSLGFTPQVWLGNDEVGLAWLAESHKGWQVDNDAKVVDIILQQDAVLLRVNIVDTAVELAELKLAFGLQASPVKPITQRQQRILCSGKFTEYPPEFQDYGLYVGDGSRDALQESYAGLPEPENPELCAIEAEKQRLSGRNPVPYSAFGYLSLGLPEMTVYGGDWYTGEPYIGTGGSANHPEPFGGCNIDDRNYQDFVVWRFVQNWKAYGGSGVYYDLFTAWQDKNPQHTKAYTSRSGKKFYSYPIRAARDIVRRRYIAYQEKNPDFAVFVNAGGGFWLPLIAFTDACGAQDNDWGADYPKYLTYDRYRTAFYGYPMGAKTLFLPSSGIYNSPALKEMTGLSYYLIGIIFNHNTDIWSAWIDQSALRSPLRIYHVGDWSNQAYLAYWKYPYLTNLDPEKFKVSGWFNATTKRGLLCVASLSAEAVTTPISLGKDWKFTDTVRLADACKEELQDVRDGTYSFFLGVDKIGATFENGSAVFKPYGVLMLSVK